VRRAVLWDSSAILALLDADDADHAAAVVVMRRLAAERRPGFITNYVEVEAHALLLRRLGRTLAREWLLTGGLPIVRVSPAEEQFARALLARRSDKDWSLCDAISFAVIDHRHVGSAFSFDHHFRQYGGVEVLGLSPADEER
jgi:predicted nucleic acid-binding protein